jgi:PD-(D/E)XK endonuclease
LRSVQGAGAGNYVTDGFGCICVRSPALRERDCSRRVAIAPSQWQIGNGNGRRDEAGKHPFKSELPLLAQSTREKWGTHSGQTEHAGGFVIPWLCAAVDPNEKWWERLRGNPKRAGEVSQAAFLLKAEMMGFDVALPWGDNQKFDFVVWRRDGRAMRVQVKGTGRLHRRGYEVQPVHTTRRGGKKRYTKKDIDVIAAHVQPVDAWYLIPIEKVGPAKSLRLYPEIKVKSSVRPILRKAGSGGHSRAVARWERWRDAWEVIGER